MIAVKDLEVGTIYRGQGRNFNIARWNGKIFVGTREKFGITYDDWEYHIDTSQRWGTFIPEEKMK